ncbi:uncharacterized protein LOC120012214 isoform X2 [Tripterygium wilfordii]|uniref:uncharacterized protein LOC120012214 isoform X2 n=1 Tax=Tripterygium wilfordii TaxID=458696 RepID=UPI0018F7FEC1|nr:uncharacterized protein LOC120012214 isoform X2 [Tripterygium wilfordii]
MVKDKRKLLKASGSKGSSRSEQQKQKQISSQSEVPPPPKRSALVPSWSRQSANSLPQPHNHHSEEDTDSAYSEESSDSSETDGESDIDPTASMDEVEQESHEEPSSPIESAGHSNAASATHEQVGKEPKERFVRRETRCLTIVGRGVNERPTIILNDKNQPIGPEKEVAHLSSYLGILARNAHLLPLTNKTWHAVKKDKRKELWDIVNFIIDEAGKRWVFATIGAAWRIWKSRLKAKHFKTHTRRSACLKDRPDKVPKEQWTKLVKRWSSQKAKLASERNTKNRMKQKYTHTMGSKSFARVREEEKKKRPNEDEPSDVDMFVLTRKRKDGTLRLDEQTRVELEQLSSQSLDTPESSLARENFMKKVFKDHPGRAPLYGKGVAPSDLKRKWSCGVPNEILENIAAREKRAIQVEEKCEAMLAGFQALVAQLKREYPNVEIPPEMLSPLSVNRESPTDIGNAPLVNRQRSSANTNSLEQVEEENDEDERDDV